MDAGNMRVTFKVNGQTLNYRSANADRYLEYESVGYQNMLVFHHILDCPEDRGVESHWLQRCQIASKAYSAGALSGYCPEYPGHSEKAMKRLAFFLKCCCWMHDHDSDYHNWLNKTIASNKAINVWATSDRYETCRTRENHPEYNFLNFD